MKNKKWALLIIILLILIAIVLLIIPMFTKDNEGYDPSKTTKQFASDIEKLNDLLINGGSKKEIIELTKVDDLENFNIMTGSDSYLNQKPSEKIIENYDLDNYVKMADKYISRLEKEIKNNFSFERNDTARDGNYIYDIVTIRSYYYSGYISDFNELKNQLLAKVQSENKDEEKSNEYKAKVKAMEILDKKLSDYRNESEELNISINYNADRKTYTKNSLYQYILSVQGFSYRNNSEMMNNNENRHIRMAEYINESLASGVLDNNDILRLEANDD